jgi:leucyl aminopeptidase
VFVNKTSSWCVKSKQGWIWKRDSSMGLSAQFSPLHEVAADWLIVGKWENEPFNGAVADLDGQLKGTLGKLVERGDITGKAKETTPLLQVQGMKAQRILVIGLGQRNKADGPLLVSVGSTAARFITTRFFPRIAMALPEDVPGQSPETVARLVGVGLRQGCEGPGLRKKKPDRHVPQEIVLVGSPSSPATQTIEDAVRRADIEGKAVSLARELVNTPPCDLYPETFAQRALEVAQKVGLACEVFSEAQLRDERMNALLAVARGSERPPRLVVLRHKKGGSGKTLGLVGKGVTFDSGGLSLKTTEQMVDMKCDMAGAAAVLGAMQAIAELDLPVNVLGILALVENMPSGKAMKLGDVLFARNGKTIEVLNTDAEGRLILADALAYAVDNKADHLVDLATLTGACLVALGTEVAGAMTNNEPWSQQILAAARACGELAWPLPMFPFYTDMIKSEIADMKNTGGSRYAGAISAAKFLEEFVGGVPWVHLDIAGPAWAEKENPSRAAGGTGCFVRTLVELARHYYPGT